MGEADDTAASPILVPTRTFAGPSQVLDLGGRRVELTYLGRGHTDNDIVVTAAQTAVIFAGDLVEEGAPPPSFEDSYPLDWPSTVEAMLALGRPDQPSQPDQPRQPGRFVPGHGAVVDRGFVLAQCAALAEVVTVAGDLWDSHAVARRLAAHRIARAAGPNRAVPLPGPTGGRLALTGRGQPNCGDSVRVRLSSKKYGYEASSARRPRYQGVLAARDAGQDRAEERDAVDVDRRGADVHPDRVHATVVRLAQVLVVVGRVGGVGERLGRPTSSSASSIRARSKSRPWLCRRVPNAV